MDGRSSFAYELFALRMARARRVVRSDPAGSVEGVSTSIGNTAAEARTVSAVFFCQ
jgi:hypothetical protein